VDVVQSNMDNMQSSAHSLKDQMQFVLGEIDEQMTKWIEDGASG
jgi:hypothetical protein